MYDLDLTLHILDQIHKSVVTISKRFEPVRSVNDFKDSPRGMINIAILRLFREPLLMVSDLSKKPL